MIKTIIVAVFIAVAIPAFAHAHDAAQLRALDNRIRQLERGSRTQAPKAILSGDTSILERKVDMLTRDNIALRRQLLELVEQVKKLETAQHAH
ncbi:MAG: hypothetical protein O2967_06960 [Proteobacteria bacterium]|nr:hypothetical protein [Pseudomonadota bacterium]